MNGLTLIVFGIGCFIAGVLAGMNVDRKIHKLCELWASRKDGGE